MTPQKELMTIRDFLAVYGISRDRFYKEMRIGAIRITKLGVRTYIKRIDADKWMSEIGKY